MDAFEARGIFNKTLRKLNASSRSNEVALYFLRDNVDLLEDLFHCMLEEMARASFNQRVNILFFVAYVVCTPSQRLSPFRTLASTNLASLIDLAVPPHFYGLSNIKHALAVLETFESQKLIDAHSAQSIRKSLDEKVQLVQSGRGEPATEPPREELLRRMDDDRERSKKAKERHIAVDPESPGEFKEFWHALGPLTDLDFEHIEEQNEIVQRSKTGLFAP